MKNETSCTQQNVMFHTSLLKRLTLLVLRNSIKILNWHRMFSSSRWPGTSSLKNINSKVCKLDAFLNPWVVEAQNQILFVFVEK